LKSTELLSYFHYLIRSLRSRLERNYQQQKTWTFQCRCSNQRTASSAISTRYNLYSLPEGPHAEIWNHSPMLPDSGGQAEGENEP